MAHVPPIDWTICMKCKNKLDNETQVKQKTDPFWLGWSFCKKCRQKLVAPKVIFTTDGIKQKR